MTNPFSNPIAPGAPDPAPRPRDLEGCLVAYAPREFTKAGAPGNTEGYEGADPRDRVTADLIVLDTGGRMIQFGGAPEIENPSKRTQHYLQVVGPAKFDSVWISNTTIVKALAPNGQALVGQLVLGRVVRSTFGRNPFNLESVEGKPDMNVAIDIYTRLSMGAIQYFTPTQIPGDAVPQNRIAAQSTAPMPPANSVSYGYAPSPVPPAPTAWTTPPVAPPTPLPPAPVVPQPVLDPAAQAQAMLAAAGLQPVPVAPPTPPPVNGLEPQLTGQGWTPETWAQLTQDQKSQVRVSVGLPPF